MSIQIKKKFIGSQVIDGSKILFLNDEAFKARKQDGSEESLFKLDTSNKLQFLVVPQLSSDPTAAEDMARKGYVDAEVSAEEARALAAEAGLQSSINALSSSGGAAVAAVQSELDATQTGAGLSSAGAYVAPVGSNYLGSAVSLKDADSKLDAAIKAEETARIADVNAEETRALAAESALDGRLDSIEGIVTSSSLSLTGSSPASITADALNFVISGAIDFGGSVLSDIGAGVASSDAATKGQLDAEVSARIADVNAEETRALAAESALDARLDIIEGADTVEGSVAKAEKDAKDYTDAREVAITSAYQAYADAAEADAKAYTDAEVAALVDSAPAVLDTLKELADALGSDPNFATTVAGQIGDVAADLAQEILDRTADVDAEESRALAAEGLLEGRLDTLEGDDTVEGSVAKAEKDANDYTDSQIALMLPLAGGTMSGDIDMDSFDINGVKTINFPSAGVGGSGASFDNQELSISGPNGDVLFSAEAITFSNSLNPVLITGVNTIGDIVSGGGSSVVFDAGVNLFSPDGVKIGAASNEIYAMFTALPLQQSAELSLGNEGRVVGLAEFEGTETADYAAPKGYVDARETAITTAYEAYTDAAIAQEVIDRNSAISTAVANLVDGAPALLDTLNELAAAIGDDENFAVTIAGQISDLDDRADALEAASVEFKAVERFVLTSTNVSNGYVDISYQAIQNSLRVSADRLALHQGFDYTVSVVGGVTRITFIGSVAAAGAEALVAGDEVYVEGAKVAIV